MPALQIIADINQLNRQQREALSGFILTFPNEDGESFCYDNPLPEGAIVPLEVPPPPVELTPAQAFGVTGQISVLGPHLVVGSQVPPPPPPANAPATTPNSAGSVGVATDKSGFPWDGRIHASGKTTNADGTWRKKRGIEATLIVQVEAELRALMAIPSPAPIVPTVAVQTIPAESVRTTVASPSVASVPPPPPPASPASLDEFVSLVGRTSAAISANKLTQEQVQKCCDAVGIPTLPLLGSRLDLVPQVARLVDSIIAGQSL